MYFNIIEIPYEMDGLQSFFAEIKSSFLGSMKHSEAI